MGRRVGMTTDLLERRNYWGQMYPQLRNWQIVRDGLSKEEAKKIENKVAFTYNCEHNTDSANPECHKEKWAVYYFEH